MPPEDRLNLSNAWLELLGGTTEPNPWVHGFKISEKDSRVPVGKCGFKGPPNADGIVEIAYAIDPDRQGKGYATEAAAALTDFAHKQFSVRTVIAHTLPQPNASTRVLAKCGFQKTGEVIDPQDGPVWRWEFRTAARS
jgi:[ribosomal protein S5]-alanine N-acetyltransferase